MEKQINRSHPRATEAPLKHGLGFSLAIVQGACYYVHCYINASDNLI